MREQAIEMYRVGKSAPEIAIATGISKDTIYGWLKQSGIERRTVWRRRVRKADTRDLEAMRIVGAERDRLRMIDAMETLELQQLLGVETNGARAVESLRDDQCRWPKGVVNVVMQFCDCAKGHGLPYCGKHVEMALKLPKQLEG